jgi:hypothetical protein
MTPRFLSAALATLLVVAPAVADVVHLADGRVLEGETRWLESGELELQLASGAILIPADQVKQVLERETPAEAFRRREAALAPEDLDGALDLARFAAGHETLHEQARALSLGLLTRVPNPRADDSSPAANEQRRLRGGVAEILSGPLDFHLVDGVWQAPEIYYPSQGFVRFRGRWVPKAEAEAIKAARRKQLAEGDERDARRAERAKERAFDRASDRVDRLARELVRAEARVPHYQAEVARHEELAAKARQRLAEWDAEVRRLDEQSYAAQLVYDRWCSRPCACVQSVSRCECGWASQRDRYLVIWNDELALATQARRERSAAQRALADHEADVIESRRRLVASQTVRLEKAAALASAEAQEAEAAEELDRASSEAEAAESKADDARQQLDDARGDD